MTPTALTIAGSDPSGGAGMQADLKTFHQLGVYGMSVVTLLTVQNTQRVFRIEVLDEALIDEQYRAVVNDIAPGAIKTGALGSVDVIERVAALLGGVACPVVIDPVMISKHGDALLLDEAIACMRDVLLPVASLVTPNRWEASRLAETDVASVDDAERAGETILSCGATAVVVKGIRNQETITDVYVDTTGNCEHFSAAYIETEQTHGSGCVYSAAITAQLARRASTTDAVRKARMFLSHAITAAPGIGQGRGPVNMFATTP